MTLLYITQPVVADAPEGTDPNALAWFAQFGSGALRHSDGELARWAGENGVPVRRANMAWSEYSRLLAEAHWYEST